MKKKLIRPTEMTEDEFLISQLTQTVESLLEKLNPELGPLVNVQFVKRIIRSGNRRLGRVSWYEKELRCLIREARKQGKPVSSSAYMAPGPRLIDTFVDNQP